MKKLLLLVVIVLVLVGCTPKKTTLVESKTSCKLTNHLVDGDYSWDINAIYDIYYTEEGVVKVSTVETIISEDAEVLEFFDSMLRELYDNMDEIYGGYDINITATDTQVVSKVTIDYRVMDLVKLVNDQPDMKQIMGNKGFYTLEGLKQVYGATGAICD